MFAFVCYPAPRKTEKHRVRRLFGTAMVLLLLLLFPGAIMLCKDAWGADERLSRLAELDRMEKKIISYEPLTGCPDDAFILVTLREAIAGVREGNGGIGACLVRESTGEIVERGHNRQYEPYFRSDLHAEMDLLTRYEERIRARRQERGTPSGSQRKIEGLVLYTSVEPCPMCLSRIINMGVKKVYFGTTDPEGGMAFRVGSLPPFWRIRAEGQTFEPARCSPALKDFARSLFIHPRKK